jgi:hypothetical protein
MRDQPTNWNPQLRILPEEYTSFWDDYWSNPFAAAEASGGGNYLEVDKNGDIKSQGIFAQALFSAYMHADDDGNWKLSMGSANGKFGFWEPDYDNFPTQGNDVVVATQFVSWDEYFGGPGHGKKSKSSSSDKMFSLKNFSLENIGIGAGALGVGMGFLDKNLIGEKMMLGFSRNAWYRLRTYPNGWGGSQYFKTFNLARNGEVLSRGLWAAGLIVDGIRWQSGEISGSKFALNSAMATYGAFGGPPGWVIGSTYFIIDNTIGWPSAIESYKMMTDAKFYMISQGIMNWSDYKY